VVGDAGSGESFELELELVRASREEHLEGLLVWAIRAKGDPIDMVLASVGAEGGADPMTSTLPSRWQQILRREAAANVGAVLAKAIEGRARGLRAIAERRAKHVIKAPESPSGGTIRGQCG
jgi:hypothetical protein